MPFEVRVAPLEQIERVLPRLLCDLSLARAQIAMDQLRAAVATGQLDRVVFLTAVQGQRETPLAAAIAIQTGAEPGSASDTATIVHVGNVDADHDCTAELMTSVGDTLESELSRRGVCFVQWATDDVEATTSPGLATDWCRGCGFAPIGTLDYLSGPVSQPFDSDEPAAADDGSDRAVHLEQVDCTDPAQLEQFARVVETTYRATLDCPELTQYRTAQQTLRGYQSSSAFDPKLWFYVRDDRAVVGCLVLANHRAASADASPVAEIVYMGLMPERRGDGRGRQLMEESFKIAQRLGAEQLILAVDKRNTPARRIYDSVGLNPILSETVWVKTIRHS